MLQTIIKAQFNAIVKLHSGTEDYPVTVHSESIDDAWCNAFDQAMLHCELREGVLLGMYIKSADASREEIRDNPAESN